MCNLFNDYIENIKDDILVWDFDIPDFFKKDKFKINIDLLKNKKTIEYIKSNYKIEYIFKIILGSFNKKRKKAIGIFNDQSLMLFNKFVDEFNSFIDKELNLNIEYELQKTNIKNFKDYWDLKYDTDSQGKIYPDVYSEFQEEGEDKKKKKSVFKGKSDLDNDLFDENELKK
jgi:hypothetical protein